MAEPVGASYRLLYVYMKIMDIYLKFSETVFCIKLFREILIEDSYRPFLVPSTVPDVTVHVSGDWENSRKPSGEPIGEDILHYYYAEGEDRFCILRGGSRGPVSCTVYTEDFSEIVCTINESAYKLPNQSLQLLLRMLPMCGIFTHFNTIFLHSSQIVYQGKGILFSAPSGTGKTTQAKLWKSVCGADIICNDRTLIRKVNGEWRTYRYPLDGSEPCNGNYIFPLGAIVYLQQGMVNRVTRLNPQKTISLLMPQMVIDHWNNMVCRKSFQVLLELFGDIPVYELTCTPDPRAVEELKRELERGI